VSDLAYSGSIRELENRKLVKCSIGQTVQIVEVVEAVEIVETVNRKRETVKGKLHLKLSVICYTLYGWLQFISCLKLEPETWNLELLPSFTNSPIF
jgi:hypothetical protein